MYTTNLRKVGGSVMLAIPPALLDVLELDPGMQVGIALKDGRLIVEPQKRRRYTLDQLLSKCSAKAVRSRADREWAGGKAAGRELL